MQAAVVAALVTDVQGITDADLEDLLYAAEDLRHDLGKYITFEVRFVGLSAETEVLRTALKADLLATDKRGDRVEPAWSVWERLRPSGPLSEALSGLPDDAGFHTELTAIDGALSSLRGLDLDALDRDGLLAAAGLARSVQDGCGALLRRCRAVLSARGV